jgi:Fur family peroxide stress response transcriptional regulator
MEAALNPESRQPDLVARRMDLFRQRCVELGLALTHQRLVIYQALAASEQHPTPESIYEQVRQQVPSISLGTVYKNIRTFVEAGLLREVSLLHDSLRLDANLTSHHHLVCIRCKSIQDLPAEAVEPVRLKQLPPGGFRPERYSVEVLGLCANCAEAP